MIPVAIRLGGVREADHAAEVGGADAGGEPGAGADRELEGADDPVADVEQDLGVRRALLDVREGQPAVDLGADLEVAVVEEEEAQARAPVEHRPLAHADEARPARRARLDRREALPAADVEAEAARPHDPIGVPADDRLGPAAERPVAHVGVGRRRALGAGGEPDVAADRDLEGIVVLAPEPRAQPEPEVAELHLARRGEGLPPGRRAAALEEGDGDVDVHVEPGPERDPAVEVQVELVLDDAPEALVRLRRAEDERVVRVVREEHHVRRQVARDEGRLDAEHAIPRGGRRESIQRDALSGGGLRVRVVRCSDDDGGGRQRCAEKPQHPVGSHGSCRVLVVRDLRRSRSIVAHGQRDGQAAGRSSALGAARTKRAHHGLRDERPQSASRGGS